MNEVKDVLQRARDLISKGWCQKAGKLELPGHAAPLYCTVGALGSVMRNTIEQWDLMTKAEIHLANTLFDGTDKSWEEWYAYVEENHPEYPLDMLTRDRWAPKMLIEWNDARGRTRDEVLAGFDRAIELAGDGD